MSGSKRSFQVDPLLIGALLRLGSEPASQSALYQELQARTGSRLSWSQVNAALRRLVRRGMLSSSFKRAPPPSSLGQSYYCLTLDGLSAFERTAEDWRRMLDGLDYVTADERLRDALLGL